MREIASIDVTRDWEIMRDGEHFAPLSGCFDGLFAVTPKEMPEADTGKTVRAYQWVL